ncbi:MAG: hypothetical protein PHX04_00340 [Bacilli bacterium]|nr:hypothetical protein [Bacilli bacterium]
MYKWVNVTENFSEEARHYMNTYLEISEVLDEQVEVSLFSSKEDLYEIYFSYDISYGIIYVDAKEAYAKREKIKEEIAKEYEINKKLTDEFINSFGEKYNVCLPPNMFFDTTSILGF